MFEQDTKEYGSERRRVRVVKYRGVDFRGGYHYYKIERGGIVVYPRLIAAAIAGDGTARAGDQRPAPARRSTRRRY